MLAYTLPTTPISACSTFFRPKPSPLSPTLPFSLAPPPSPHSVYPLTGQSEHTIHYPYLKEDVSTSHGLVSMISFKYQKHHAGLLQPAQNLLVQVQVKPMHGLYHLMLNLVVVITLLAV